MATSLGQSTAGRVAEESPYRAVRMDRAVRLPSPDQSLQQNPLRNGLNSSFNPSLRSGSTSRPNTDASSPTIRQVSYQQDSSRDESTNDSEVNEFDELSETDELSESDELSELDELSESDDQSEPDDRPELNGPSESDDFSETNIDDLPESVSLESSDVRAPIRDNPFAEARQHDPQGLLLETVDHAPKFVVEKYSDISGRGSSYQLAGYNAHRFRHNPLYFEEPNLERYGNELESQRFVSAVRFFSNAVTLPIRLLDGQACSRITTLGFRRPGEFVPYRHYGQWSPEAARFHSSRHPQRILQRR